MGLLDVLRKRKKDYSNPFVVQGLATGLLADPVQEDFPHALYTLSDLNDKEISSLAMLLALESMLQSQLGEPTVLSSFVDSIVLLKRSRKRKGEKAIVSMFSKARIQAPISLAPVKSMVKGGDEDEEG